jgi:NitT/TauT family transport system substrate-binding protein
LSQASRVSSPGLANRYIAKKLGYYQQEGADVEFGFTEGGSQLIQLLAAGQTDMATTALDPLIKTGVKGQDLGLIGVYNQNSKIYYQLATKPESSIRKITDLRGKKIGVSSMASQVVNYARFLLRNSGLDPDKDVKFIAVKQDIPAAKALYDGVVDVLALWDLTYSLMENEGFKLKYIPQHSLIDKVTGNAIIVRRDYLEKNRNLLMGVLRAWAKATVFMLENPEATARIYAELFPESLPKGKTREEGLKNILRIIQIRSPIYAVDTSKGEKWGEFEKDRLLLYVKEYLEIDPARIDISKYYTNELINKVNEFDEKAVRLQARNYK